jgi:hypothetical protein
MLRQDDKRFIPTELGPWLIGGISYKEADDLDEGKEFIVPNHAHLHKRTFLKLPNINPPDRNSLSTKKSKFMLKMSHQSLDIGESTLNQTSNKSRYGALNGSVLHAFKTKGKGEEWKSLQIPNPISKTIDVLTLDRKVSMVQMGEPTLSHRATRHKNRRLMNE